MSNRNASTIILQWLPILISLSALVLSGIAYYDAKKAQRPQLSISVGYGGGGHFFATVRGVAHHAQYDVINLTPRTLVARDMRATTALASEYPPNVWINGREWDHRPFSFEPDVSYRIEYLARRDAGSSSFENWSGSDLEGYELGNLYADLIRGNFIDESPWLEISNLPTHPSSAQSYIIAYFNQLLNTGYLFSGLSGSNIDLGQINDMRVQFGGACQEYLVHLPNICLGLEIQLVTGETFSSPLEGYGVRSEQMIPMIAEAYSEAET